MQENKSDTCELNLLSEIFSMAIHSAEKSKQILCKREKVRKCLKKKQQNRGRGPKDPKIFQWDTFVMGKNSYFYYFKDFRGEAMRSAT